MNFAARRPARIVAISGLVCWFFGMAHGMPQQSSLPQNGSDEVGAFRITGTVVSATTGAPLAQARVSLAETKNRENVASLVTNDSGHFEFSRLKAGKFALTGAKRGYISSNYDQHEQYSTAIVTGPGYAPENLVLRLTPMALISGQVFDEAEEPIRNAQVVIFREDHNGGMTRINRLSSSVTDDRGYYDFAQLRPANYFLSVTAKPWYAIHPADASGITNGSASQVSPGLDVAYPTTYFNGSSDSDSATPIEVKGADRLRIDLRLNPVPALHVLVRVGEGEPSAALFRKFPQLQKRVFDSIDYQRIDFPHLVAPGVYELTGIPAGRYTVRIADPNTGEFEQSNDVDLSRNGQSLNDSRGEPVGSLSLSLRMPGDEPLPKQYSVSLLNSGRRPVAVQQGDPSGQVSFQDLAPGKYAIYVNSVTPRLFVDRITAPAGDSLGHDVTVSPGAAVNLTAYLSAGMVDIEGVVQTKDKAVAGVMVALVPKDAEANTELFRRDQSDFDGTFILPSVIPGSYTVVAVQDAWGFDWLKPSVLQRFIQRGESVNIGEKARGTLHLPRPVEVQQR
jgi:hypothetical protein